MLKLLTIDHVIHDRTTGLHSSPAPEPRANTHACRSRAPKDGLRVQSRTSHTQRSPRIVPPREAYASEALGSGTRGTGIVCRNRRGAAASKNGAASVGPSEGKVSCGMREEAVSGGAVPPDRVVAIWMRNAWVRVRMGRMDVRRRRT